MLIAVLIAIYCSKRSKNYIVAKNVFYSNDVNTINFSVIKNVKKIVYIIVLKIIIRQFLNHFELCNVKFVFSKFSKYVIKDF